MVTSFLTLISVTLKQIPYAQHVASLPEEEALAATTFQLVLQLRPAKYTEKTWPTDSEVTVNLSDKHRGECTYHTHLFAFTDWAHLCRLFRVIHSTWEFPHSHLRPFYDPQDAGSSSQHLQGETANCAYAFGHRKRLSSSPRGRRLLFPRICHGSQATSEERRDSESQRQEDPRVPPRFLGRCQQEPSRVLPRPEAATPQRSSLGSPLPFKCPASGRRDRKANLRAPPNRNWRGSHGYAGREGDRDRVLPEWEGLCCRLAANGGGLCRDQSLRRQKAASASSRKGVFRSSDRD